MKLHKKHSIRNPQPYPANLNQSRFDLSLFEKTTHNPSYASLTRNFELLHGLKDYCIPVNNYFPPAAVMEKLYKRIPSALKYYPSSNGSIAEYIARFSEIDNSEQIIVGNGSTEIISWLNSLFIKDSLFVPIPSFGRWIEEPLGLGIDLRTIRYPDEKEQHLSAEDYVAAVKKSKAKNAVICNPNNPTGSIFSKSEILWILGQLTQLDNIVIDESFIDFSSKDPPTIKNEVHLFKNAWVLKSLGKNLGLHGLRMGYAISCVENIHKMKKHLPHWNINGVSESLLSLITDEQESYEESRIRTIEDAKYLLNRFQQIEEFTVFPSNSNFIFVKLCKEIDGEELRNSVLQNHSILIRNCANKLGSSKQYFRVAARHSEDIDYLAASIKHEINSLK